MKTLTIEVTQEDIDESRRIRERHPAGYSGNSFCPIACSLRRTTGYGAGWVTVDYDEVYVWADSLGNGDSFQPSQRMLRFMRGWDAKEKAKPTRFRIKEDDPNE